MLLAWHGIGSWPSSSPGHLKPEPTTLSATTPCAADAGILLRRTSPQIVCNLIPAPPALRSKSGSFHRSFLLFYDENAGLSRQSYSLLRNCICAILSTELLLPVHFPSPHALFLWLALPLCPALFLVAPHKLAAFHHFYNL